MKDNATYMNTFPLRSPKGELDGNDLVEYDHIESNRIIKDEELLEHVRNMIRC
jgi:hypothetical protein